MIKKYQIKELGLSLTETLIVGGILGGMALVGAKLFETQSRGQKQVESSYEIVNVLQSQNQILSNINNCTETFRGKNPASGTVSALKRYRMEPTPGFDDVYEVNKQIVSNVRVLSYNLEKRDIPAATLETMLKIDFNRGKSSMTEVATKLLRLGYTVDGDGNIETCWAMINNVDSYWIQSSIDPADIFYSAGQVGIGAGMSDPQRTLDVLGDFQVADGTNSLLVSGLNLQGSAALALSPGLTLSGPLSVNGPTTLVGATSVTGNTSITGQLTVSGRTSVPTLVASTAVQSPSFQYTSDRSLKEDIRPILSPLSRISQLRGVNFRWKDSGIRDIGFIAQEVAQMEPGLAILKENGQSSVKYGNVSALLVEALKELRTEVQDLRKKNELLEKRILELEAR